MTADYLESTISGGHRPPLQRGCRSWTTLNSTTSGCLQLFSYSCPRSGFRRRDFSDLDVRSTSDGEISQILMSDRLQTTRFVRSSCPDVRSASDRKISQILMSGGVTVSAPRICTSSLTMTTYRTVRNARACGEWRIVSQNSL